MKIVLTISLLLLLSIPTYSQTKEIILRGTIKQGVHSKPIDPKEKANLEKELNAFSDKMDLLTTAFQKLNAGDTAEAQKMLSKADPSYTVYNSEGYGYEYFFYRMKQLGVLYKPFIQINDSTIGNHMIVCTDKQIDELEKTPEKEFEIRCDYIGSILIDNTQVYQLISYK